jgi:hypothetical protein
VLCPWEEAVGLGPAEARGPKPTVDATRTLASGRANGSTGKEQGLAMQLGSHSGKRLKASFRPGDPLGDLPLIPKAQATAAPVRHQAKAGAHGRRPAFFRQRCARAAAQIRSSAGVTTYDAGHGGRVERRLPWLRLLLWGLACAGLFVSLVMRAEDLDRDHRLAARDTLQERSLDSSHRAQLSIAD